MLAAAGAETRENTLTQSSLEAELIGFISSSRAICTCASESLNRWRASIHGLSLLGMNPGFGIGINPPHGRTW